MQHDHAIATAALQYIAAVVMLGIGLAAGWILCERSASTERIPYVLAEPAAGRLRLDSLVLKRNPGLTPRPQYEISINAGGGVTYRGHRSSRSPGSGTQVFGREGEYSGRIELHEVQQLVSLAIWPERSSDSRPVAGFDSPYAELTLFFSKVLIGGGDPEFASLIEELLSGTQWDTAGVQNER